MAEKEEVPAQEVEEDEDHPDYKPPAPKSLGEILSTDQEDESLRKYKEALLGGGGKAEPLEPGNPLNVIVKKLAIMVDDRPDVEIDLTKPIEEIKQSKIELKEGIAYKVKIFFLVQREIVTGLKYRQKTFRKGIKVDSSTQMVGSYGPCKDKETFHVFTSPQEEAPKGMIARGEYKVHSSFVDDDKNIYLEWDWLLKIKKDWSDTE